MYYVMIMWSTISSSKFFFSPIMLINDTILCKWHKSDAMDQSQRKQSIKKQFWYFGCFEYAMFYYHE